MPKGKKNAGADVVTGILGDREEGKAEGQLSGKVNKQLAEKETEIESLKAKLAAIQEMHEKSGSTQVLIERLASQNERLLDQVVGEKETDSELFNVVSTMTVVITFEVTDVTGTRQTPYRWEREGQVHKFTGAQIREAVQRYPHLFAEGYLDAPEYTELERSANLIPDMEVYMEEMSDHGNAINAAMAKIDSPVTLTRIFNHVENQRFGEMVEGTDGVELEELEISTKLEKIQRAASKRLRAIGGVELSRG